jgi:hypothetical protein
MNIVHSSDLADVTAECPARSETGLTGFLWLNCNMSGFCASIKMRGIDQPFIRQNLPIF